jgi:outer membrane protein assembly factor BamB
MTAISLGLPVLLFACEASAQPEARLWATSLESVDGLTTGWGQVCDDIQVTLNEDAAFVAEGKASVRLVGRSRADGEGNRYLSLNVPVPDIDLTQGAITFGAWTSRPEATKAFYVRAFSADGTRVASWYDWGGALAADADHVFELQPELSLSGLAWEARDTDPAAGPVQRLEFIIGTDVKGAEIDLFLDNVCIVPARYRKLADVTAPPPRLPDTPLVAAGRAEALIVRPADPGYEAAARALADGLREAGGVEVPIETDERARADLPALLGEMKQTTVLLLGNVGNNRALLPLYSHAACYADAVFPGPGGYELRTVCDPWGTGKNVIAIGASDTAGAEAGVRALLARLQPGADLVLPRTVEVTLGAEAERRWGSAFTRELGDGYLESVRKEAERRIDTGAHTGLGGHAAEVGEAYALTGRDDYAQAFVWLVRRWAEHHDTQPDTYGGPWGMDADFTLYRLIPAWDAVEESPVLTDQDRLDVVRILARFTNEDCVPKASGVVGNERVRFNHQTFPALGLYFAGDYFSRCYGLADAAEWLRIAEACFAMQAKAWKPYEDCNGYQWLTLGHLIRYALAKPDFAYFENGNARKAADFAILSSDNLGYSVTYGDTGAFMGWWSENPILAACAWYYDDPTYRWAAALKREVSGRVALGDYTADGEAEPPTGLLGAQAFALDPYYHRTFGGPDVLPVEAAVDKVAMRSGYDRQDAYLLLDGLSNGGHRHYDGNSISRWTERGRIWLADADYIKSLPKFHNGVLILRDGASQTIPDFCELERLADLPDVAHSTTTLRSYAGADWRRHIIWLKGLCFIVADQLIAREAGAFSLRPVWQTLGRFTEVPGGIAVQQQGEHAAIICAPTAPHALTDDPDTGRNWSAYRAIDEPVVRRFQPVHNVDLKAGQAYTIFTVLRASGEQAPAVVARCPAPGVLYAEVDGTPVVAGVVPPGEEGQLLDLAFEAEAFVARSNLVGMFGLRRATYGGQELSTEAPVDVQVNADRMEVTVHSEEETAAFIPYAGRMVVPKGTTQQDLPIAAAAMPQMAAQLLQQIAGLPGLQAAPLPAPEGLPELQVLFSHREVPAAYLLTGNVGAPEAVDLGVQVASDPPPLAQNVFGKEGEANDLESLFDGDTTTTAGGVMWDSGQPVTLSVTLDAPRAVEAVVLRAWYATGSSKGKVFQIRSIRLDGSDDGFADDRRRLSELTDLDSRPSWGGTPQAPHAYRFEGLGAQACNLRLTIIPRTGEEVEGDADPAQCGIYLAELEVWGRGADLETRLRQEDRPTFEATAAADVDGDGRDEVIAGHSVGKVSLLGADGAVRWTADLGAPVRAVAAVPLADNGLAIVAGGDGGLVRAWRPDGTDLWSFTVPYYKRAPHVRVLFGARFGDGNPAVIAGADSWRYYALDRTGQELWHCESVHASTAGAAGDVDGDGVDEVACGTEYYWWPLANAKGERVWSYSTSTGPTANACAIGDLNADGRREVLFGGADSHVHAVGPDGKLLWKANTGDEVTALACADVDADGAEEVLVGSLSFNVYALKGDGTTLWRTDTGAPVVDLVLSGDRACALTADGRACLLEAGTGKWLAQTKLPGPGLSLAAGDGQPIKAVATTADGQLHALAW